MFNARIVSLVRFAVFVGASGVACQGLDTEEDVAQTTEALCSTVSNLSSEVAGQIRIEAAGADCNEGGVPLYLFRAKPPLGTWQTMCTWQTATSCEFDPSSTPGTWRTFVLARATGDSARAKSNLELVTVGPSCDGNVEGASFPDVVANGDLMTLSATANCEPDATPEFRFRGKPWPAGTWQTVCDWSTDANCLWNTTGASDSSYRFVAQVRAAGRVGVDSTGGFWGDLGGDCDSVDIDVTPEGNVAAGESITVTAIPNCASTPEFRFAYDDGSGWAFTSYGPSDTFVVDTSVDDVGTHRFRAFVRAETTTLPDWRYFARSSVAKRVVACPTYPPPEPDPDFCTELCPCEQGQGGCDADNECAGDKLCSAGTCQEPPAVLLAAGDIANCGSNVHDSETAALLAAHPDGLVAALGDLAYPDGTATDFANCFDPTWGAEKSRMMPAPGNHEYYTTNAAGYYGYFGAAAHGPNGYYSYEHGDWHIVVLNSACDQAGLDCDAQLDWLETDLGASAAPCTLAYWHHPRYSTGFHGDADEDGEENMVPFWDALATADAEIVLSGHDHHYERFLPSSGLVQFVVGTGGATLRSTAISSAGTSAFRQHTAYGVLQLKLWSGGYESGFLPVGGGAALDVQGLTPCH